MGSIVLLDELTINKIAAGEVVDRPASIVKELVENSIDAKAKNITVEIKNGGIKYIKVEDNGIGFASDDVEMAFERHATSKIRKEEDLLSITSMGFRGEALASIAAISKVALTTKNIDEKIGTYTKVEAGNIISKSETAYTTGTKIEIRDIFYNVPARFKFLKKDYTEAGYIEDVMTREALANPDISFKYINNNKMILKTSGSGNLKDVIYDIFGKEIYNNVIELNYELNQMKVTGMIGLPPISRSTRMHQFTFINSRYIKDKTINSSIDKASEQKYAINKYPFIVMNLEVNPAHIDVNVHPAKLEVKFDDESKVFEVVYHAIRQALEEHERRTSPFTNISQNVQQAKIDQISRDLKNNGMLNSINYTSHYNSLNFSNIQSNHEEKTDDNFNPFVDNNTQNSLSDNVNSNSEGINIEYTNEYNNALDTNTNLSLNESVDQTNIYNAKNNSEEENLKGFVNEELIKKAEELKYTENVSISDVDNKKEDVVYKYIGQVFDTYIIIQIKDTMYIIDQHAAHERLLFEQIKKAYYSKDKETQLLLLPILVELSTKEMDVVNNNLEMFEEAGFMLSPFSDTSIKIEGVPNIGYDIDYQSMFKDIIDELMGANKTQKSEKEFRFLATLACKAAVKGRMKLDRQEQISLIEEMVKLENPFTCPHGRPTAYEITKYEIERRFLRK